LGYEEYKAVKNKILNTQWWQLQQEESESPKLDK